MTDRSIPPAGAASAEPQPFLETFRDEARRIDTVVAERTARDAKWRAWRSIGICQSKVRKRGLPTSASPSRFIIILASYPQGKLAHNPGEDYHEFENDRRGVGNRRHSCRRANTPRLDGRAARLLGTGTGL